MSTSKPKEKESSSKFRARRLSVSDIDTSEFDKNTSSPSATKKNRARRMSMSPEMGHKPAIALPFDVERVGTYSCHGLEPGMRNGETTSKINQDRGAVCHPFADDPNKALFCVYDGHGVMGDKVSHYVMNKISEVLEDHPCLDEDPETALKESFVAVDNSLRADPSINAELSGTTAVVVLMIGNELWIGNSGDSRAVICRNNEAVDLSIDQKPDSPEEMKRIRKAGGYVSPPEVEWGGPARVWLDETMTLPGLAMGRSLGDHLVSKVGVIAEPEVTHFTIGPDDSFIVLASDGVWEFIESDQACAIIQNGAQKGALSCCRDLILQSQKRWREEEGDYSDDITAIILFLPIDLDAK